MVIGYSFWLLKLVRQRLNLIPDMRRTGIDRDHRDYQQTDNGLLRRKIQAKPDEKRRQNGQNKNAEDSGGIAA